jgi:hypothetical protein
MVLFYSVASNMATASGPMASIIATETGSTTSLSPANAKSTFEVGTLT